MKSEAFTGTLLTLLLFGFLVPLAEIQLIEAQTELHDKGNVQLFQNGCLNMDWRSEIARSWGDFACIDEDSAELVIGVNSARIDAPAKVIHTITASGGQIVDTISNRGNVLAIVADMSFDLIPTFMYEMEAGDASRYVEPNFKFHVESVPNDPYWGQQWGLSKIEADWAWNTTMGDRSVLVAVIDTGIDYGHPDLSPNYVPLGYDWVNNDTDPMDDNGHGTHVAGIIAATANNNLGIAGLAQVRIMAEKAFNRLGVGYTDKLAEAIIHAVDQGAKILSNSWGSYSDSALLHDAVKYAYDAGVLVVAAAGNSATNDKGYPAAYDEVVAVTATDQYDIPAEFANLGKWIEVAAPGVDIYSTVPNGSYAYMSGTSMATPFASGVGALIWSRFPSMTQDQVRAQLRYNAEDLGESGFDQHYGYGRINAKRAVEGVQPSHDLLIFEWKRPCHVFWGDQVTFRTMVLNFGTSNETNVEVQLLINDTPVNSTSIVFLPSGASCVVDLSWTQTDFDDAYNVASYVVPVSGETVTQNNLVNGVLAIHAISVPYDYPTIQGAINDGCPGDVIFVGADVYHEDIVVDEALSLYGEDPATTIIDGNGGRTTVQIKADNVCIYDFTIRNAAFYGNGMCVEGSNCRVIGNNIEDCGWVGVQIFGRSENNFIGWNNIAKNGCGVFVSPNNSIIGNNITKNSWSIRLLGGGNSTIAENNIVSNSDGIYLNDSSDNSIYHNNFINNARQIRSYTSINSWDNGYPSGGNYWSNYTGSDDKKGPNQDQLGSDGIGDTSHVIDANNTDRYPFISPWVPYNVAVTNVTHSRTCVDQGYSININVTVTNRGTFTETFDVTLYQELGLIGYWKLNEGTGAVANDISENNNRGTLINGPAWVDGRSSKALDFDGTNDYVTIPDSPSLNITKEITLAAWIKTNFPLGDFEAPIIEKGAISDYRNPYSLRYRNGRIKLILVSETLESVISEYSNYYVNDSNWHHVAGTYDSDGNWRIYINGKLDSWGNVKHQDILSNNMHLYIGTREYAAGGYDEFFNGIIDEVKIYDKALSEREIKTLAEYSPVTAWNKTYGGTGSDVAGSVQQTSGGGYIIAGSTNSYGTSVMDIWLVKTDAYGNVEWNKTYGGPGQDRAWSVLQTNDGGYIIAGRTNSYGAGSYDFWLVKTDAIGNALWNRTYGGIGSEWANSVLQINDGGYIVLGSTGSYGAGAFDFLLIRTDAEGNIMWNKTYGGINDDFGSSVQPTSDGGYVIAGTMDYSDTGNCDAWLIKTDSSGNAIWNKTYGGIGYDEVLSIQQTSDSGYIMAGTTNSYGAGNYDVWLVKTDSFGNVVWNKTYGGTGDDTDPWSVQQTHDGGYIISSSTNSSGEGDYDFWLIKTDVYGNIEWDETYGGTNTDYAYAAQQTRDEGYIVVGSTKSFGAGTYDFWLLKLASPEHFAKTQTVTLESGASTIITFTWNTSDFAKGNYTISAYAWPLPGETCTPDNLCVDGSILVTKVGDLGGGLPPQFFNFDEDVDGIDLAMLIQCYKNLAPPEAMYLADLGGGLPPQFFACDEEVDGIDLALFIQCYKGLGP